MGNMFGGDAPAIPEPKPPAPMPDPESPAVLEAKRKSAVDAMQRRGRASTILTAEPALGAGRPNRSSSSGNYTGPGGSYTGITLGGR